MSKLLGNVLKFSGRWHIPPLVARLD